MCAVVLLDLAHACRCGCTDRLLSEEAAAHAHLFVLLGGGDVTETPVVAYGDARLLDSRSTAECVYRLKRAADDLDVHVMRVITSERGRERLLRYQQLLFTALYNFTYRLGCPRPAHTHSPEDEEEDVTSFLHTLPALGGPVRLLTSSLIPDCFGHGFSTRSGGVSYIPSLSSLNLFSSSRRRDPPAVVQENRRRLALHAGFHPRPLHLAKVSHCVRKNSLTAPSTKRIRAPLLQVKHSNQVWIMGEAEPESYDAIVTDRPGQVVAAPGADCIPIIFVDPVSKVVGVAHAGWRGTQMGVAMATVEAMVTHFGCQAKNILVVLGPSVGACCFTLEQEQASNFHQDCVTDPQSATPHVNIRLANRLLLQRGGVLPEHIHDDTVTDRSHVTPCTCCHPGDFFSHARDGPNFGTQVGFVWIKEVGTSH
ncbi:purine nucleoside phosphorylase LACC1 isoform X2 [Dunckerocampus dactyliophorus]|uniref:purine nucleoside phosphorylase LACC1 isoform X2 n=1 Tax=Dunckerocampus dactyliophorus TaxID=161453 RepID=UPI002404DAD3|nr:purine nucleoside phosphorylase LACC1 isoform X2 [Dunckerocampus dactyliophorus]